MGKSIYSSKQPAKSKGQEKMSSSVKYLKKIQALKKKLSQWEQFYAEEHTSEREAEWDLLETSQSQLCNEFAWAVPDERALKILTKFSPLIEIGAGKGYWGKLLREKSVDIVCFDKYVHSKNSVDCWTKVLKGDANKLTSEKYAGRTLFLCYPDEQESLAIACLERYGGEYVVHIGEMIHTGTMAGSPVAPFGRTTSADFQVALAADFHCLLKASLQNRFPNSKDCISVWKRTNFVPGREDSSSDSNNSSSDSDSSENNGSSVMSDDANEEEEEGEGEEREEEEEEEEKGEEEEGAPPTQLDASEVEYMSMSDLAKLREQGSVSDTKKTKKNNKNKQGEMKKKKEKAQLRLRGGSGGESEAFGLMSMADLAKLREADSGGGKKTKTKKKTKLVQKGEGEEEEEEEEEEGEEGEEVDINVLREMALDRQYDESGDNVWADIPLDEQLPEDIAAPCLAYLLERDD